MNSRASVAFGRLRHRRWFALLLWASTCPVRGHAQPSPPPEIAPYFSNGADLMSVPAPGQPGSEYFSNGAAATTVPEAGQPGAEYFSQGAGQMDVAAPTWPGPAYFAQGAYANGFPQAGQPGSEYFSQGASATGVAASVYPGPEYFSEGADATGVASAGPFGSEYFSRGADTMSDPRLGWFIPQTAAPAPSSPEPSEAAPAETTEPAASAEVEAAPEPAQPAQEIGEEESAATSGTSALDTPASSSETCEPAAGAACEPALAEEDSLPSATASNGPPASELEPHAAREPADAGVAAATLDQNGTHDRASTLRASILERRSGHASVTTRSESDREQRLRELIRALLIGTGIAIGAGAVTAAWLWKRFRFVG